MKPCAVCGNTTPTMYKSDKYTLCCNCVATDQLKPKYKSNLEFTAYLFPFVLFAALVYLIIEIFKTIL